MKGKNMDSNSSSNDSHLSEVDPVLFKKEIDESCLGQNCQKKLLQLFKSCLMTDMKVYYQIVTKDYSNNSKLGHLLLHGFVIFAQILLFHLFTISTVIFGIAIPPI
jgi:hypothetical protein